MNRWVGLVNLVQAAVFGWGAMQLTGRWMPAAALMVLAASAQVFAAAWALMGKAADEPRYVRWASVVSLAAVAVLVGCVAQVGVHIIANFTPIGAKQGWQLMGGVALGLPWFTFFPLYQLFAAKPTLPEGGGTAAAILLGLLLPPLWGQMQQGNVTEYPAVDGETAARWLYNRSAGKGEMWLLPEGPGPVALVVTLVHNGQILESQSVEGETLQAALSEVTIRTRERGAVVVAEFAVREGPIWQPWLSPKHAMFVRPADTGLRGDERVLGSLEVWRTKAVKRREILPEMSLPSLAIRPFAEHDVRGWVQLQGWIASKRRIVRMDRMWTAPPEVTPDSVLQAALAGGRHIARNMHEDGTYAYVVEGPSGKDPQRGYNYPRHAGGTWFLARLAQRTDEEPIWDAARAGLNHLGEVTKQVGDGRAYVLDPKRRDGKAWVGTTALAALAAMSLDERHDLRDAWMKHVASAVDEDGQVRGDFSSKTGEWPVQDQVTYAQGQGMLALAVAAREGLPGMREPLERAADYVESGRYWPSMGGSLFVLDEHWMCLAVLVAEEVLERPSGRWVCDAYVRQIEQGTPVSGSPLQPPNGPMAGLSEAVIARAEMDRRAGVKGEYYDMSMQYGELFLGNMYRQWDRPLVARGTLLGGFREGPWNLDVRVDAVQHTGCALLGIEQLLRGQAVPGGMP